MIANTQLRWNKFYDLLMKSNENFRKELNKYLEMNEEKRLKYLESDETKKDDGENYDLSERRSLHEFKTNTYLWEFLIKNSSTINNIKNWNIYIRATEIGIELPTQKIKYKKEAYTLLLEGKIDIFNERRKKDEFRDLNLSSAKLLQADFSSAIIRGTNFSKSIIITPMKYEKLILDENTKFNDAIIDDPDFIDQISKKNKICSAKDKR